jgi:vacuolar protein sorting-associated protein 53
LAEKFSGGTAGARNKESGSDEEDEGAEHNKIVSDIRKKYEKKLAGPDAEVEQVSASES